MTIFYLVTTFVVQLIGVEAADKAISGTWHLPDEGVAASREGLLAGQRSGGLGRDVQVVDVRGVQIHLIAKMAELTDQAIGAPLWGRWSCLQGPEAGTIHSFSLSLSFSYKIVYNVEFYAVEKKYWGQTPLLGRLAACTWRWWGHGGDACK
jgi:hypothetical protein